MPNQETLDLFYEATKAIFAVEQQLRKEEGMGEGEANEPIYRIRLEWMELQNRYMANLPICEYRTTFETTGKPKAYETLDKK